jgi:hypothetical protein
MEKIDMIYDLVKSVNDKLDKHITQTSTNNCQTQDDRGITLKEWGIISGIFTVICGTVVTVAEVIWG